MVGHCNGAVKAARQLLGADSPFGRESRMLMVAASASFARFWGRSFVRRKTPRRTAPLDSGVSKSE